MRSIGCLMKGFGSGIGGIVIEDDRDVLMKCIETSRVLSELNTLMKSKFVSPAVIAYADMQAVRQVFKFDREFLDLNTLFLATVAKEKDFGADICSALFNRDILRTGSMLEPTLKNICMIHGEFSKGEKVSTAKLGPVLLDLSEDIKADLEHVSNDERTDGLLRSLCAYLIFELKQPFGTNRLLSLTVFHMFLHSFGLLEGCTLWLFSDDKSMKRNNELISEIKVDGKTKNWFLFMLEQIHDTVLNILQKEFSAELLAEDFRDRYSNLPFFSDCLADLLYSNVFVKISDLVSAGVAERVTATKYLVSLEDLGLLESIKIGRERIFKNIGLFKIIVDT